MLVLKVSSTAVQLFSGLGSLPSAKSHSQFVVRPNLKLEIKSNSPIDAASFSAFARVIDMTVSAAITEKSAKETSVFSIRITQRDAMFALIAHLMGKPGRAIFSQLVSTKNILWIDSAEGFAVKWAGWKRYARMNKWTGGRTQKCMGLHLCMVPFCALRPDLSLALTGPLWWDSTKRVQGRGLQ